MKRPHLPPPVVETAKDKAIFYVGVLIFFAIANALWAWAVWLGLEVPCE